MLKRIQAFLERREWLIPLTLAVVFILITLPGTEWGLPNGWNPDELIQRVLKALEGEWAFDESNFDYPSLPKYAMFWLGRLIESWGFGQTEIILAARKLSVQLGAGVVVLAYAIARKLGAGLGTSTLAALIVLSSSELAQHARYAHNDVYLAFFVALVVWASISIVQRGGRGWFYLSAFIVGLAASSKYNGGALLLLPFALYIFVKGKDLLKDKLGSAETLGIGLLFSFAGYALGTPKALFWMTFYFKRLIPALTSHANYGYRPGRVRGLIGQWEVLPNVLGEALLVLAIASLLFLLWRGWAAWRAGERRSAALHLVLPLAWLAYDIPIMLSYNYPERFFLPMVPLFAMMIALAAEHIWRGWRESGHRAAMWLGALGMALLIAYSFARVASIALLFQNDARIPASEFIAELPPSDSVEYTLYPPIIDREKFARAHNYPIFFIKQPGGDVPAGKIYEFNTGAAGIAERQTQYLVFDSFTYRRFEDDYVCELNPVDCEFFGALLAGEAGYEEIAFFQYALPDWLPQMQVSFMNPDIKIFERIQE